MKGKMTKQKMTIDWRQRKMTKQNLPVEWQEVLGKLQERYSHVVIAGGALRDLENDRPINDVDIWVIDDTILKGSSPVFDIDMSAESSSSSGTTLKNISRVVKINQYGIDFDVIFTNGFTGVTSLLESFIDNISRIAYDGNYIARHTSYIEGHNTNTLMVDWEKKNNNSGKRAQERISKLKNKYQEYTLLEKNRP